MGIEVAAANAPYELKKSVLLPSADPRRVLSWSNRARRQSATSLLFGSNLQFM